MAGRGDDAEAEGTGLRLGEEFLGSPKEVPLWQAGRPGRPGVSARRLGALGTESSRPCSRSRRTLEVAKASEAEEDARFSRSLLWSFFCLVRRFWNQTFTLGERAHGDSGRGKRRSRRRSQEKRRGSSEVGWGERAQGVGGNRKKGRLLVCLTTTWTEELTGDLKSQSTDTPSRCSDSGQWEHVADGRWSLGVR